MSRRAHSVFVLMVMVVAPSGSFAQAARTTDYAVAAGMSLRGAERGSLGGNLAIDLRLHATHWWGAHQGVGTRAAVALDFFPTLAAAIPSCAPGGACQTKRSFSSVISTDVEAVARPGSQSAFSLTAGSGLYLASTGGIGKNRDGHRSVGALGLGAGVESTMHANRLGIGLRARYFPTGLGEIRWLSTWMISLRM